MLRWRPARDVDAGLHAPAATAAVDPVGRPEAFGLAFGGNGRDAGGPKARAANRFRRMSEKLIAHNSAHLRTIPHYFAHDGGFWSSGAGSTALRKRRAARRETGQPLRRMQRQGSRRTPAGRPEREAAARRGGRAMAAVDSSAARGGVHGTIEAAERRFGKGEHGPPPGTSRRRDTSRPPIGCAVGGFGRNGRMAGANAAAATVRTGERFAARGLRRAPSRAAIASARRGRRSTVTGDHGRGILPPSPTSGARHGIRRFRPPPRPQPPIRCRKGAIRVAALAALCRKDGMPAVAVTDTGNLFGAVGSVATPAPTPGCSRLSAANSASRRKTGPLRATVRKRRDRIVLLAQNETGYRNLIALSSGRLSRLGHAGAASGPGAARPEVGRVDRTLGRRVGAGRTPSRPPDSKTPRAAGSTSLAEIFPGRLYVEIQRHGLAEEAAVEGGLLALAYETGLPLVAHQRRLFPHRRHARGARRAVVHRPRRLCVAA